MVGTNMKYYEQRGHSVLWQIQEETLEKTIDRQLKALRPEDKAKVKNTRNPPLWVLAPAHHTDPATWSRAPKYKNRLPPRIFPISILNALVVKHYKATGRVPLGIRGPRWEHLLYVLLATLITPPNNKCVLVVDCDGDFEVSRILEATPVSLLPLPPDKQPWKDLDRWARHKVRPPYHRAVNASDLAHIYVIRPADTREGPLCREILKAKQYMMYGSHKSRDRDFWGTVIIGADDPGADVDVVCDTMKCWMKVFRFGVRNLAQRGVKDYKSGLEKREEQYRAKAEAPLIARCPWGRFMFNDRGLIFRGRPRLGGHKAGGSRYYRRKKRAPHGLRPAEKWLATRAELKMRRRQERAERRGKAVADAGLGG